MLETTAKKNLLRAISPSVEFSKPFPAGGPSIKDTDRALFERFEGVGKLSAVIDYIVEHGPRTGAASIGLLNTKFRAENAAGNQEIDVTPIGANSELLLGYFSLQGFGNRHRAIEEDDIIDLFGVPARIGESTIGYVALDRITVGPTGLGIMKYTGRAAVFDHTPNSEHLYQFVSEVVSGTDEFPMARTDICAEPTKQL